MKTEVKIDLTFEQIPSLVNQLPKKEKLKLAKELEKDAIDLRLTRLLKTFNTDDLDINTINEEVESVRQEIYNKQKSLSHF